MCFNLNLPLVEAGTNGYDASVRKNSIIFQCIPIFKGKTQCYQCVEKIQDQSFPVCTIRQKPEKLIHCIVWAKALYEGLFGPKEQSNNIVEDIVQELQATEGDRLVHAKIVFQRLFQKEIEQLITNIRIKIESGNLSIEEIQSEQEFLVKIKMLLIEQYEEDIQNNLNNSDYKLNNPALIEENALLKLTLAE